MSNLKTVPFTFDDILNESKELFNEAGFDVADGSNTSQLSAVIAYIVSSLNTNTAININETLLPYAKKRKNILQDARVLGYEAIHKTSYMYKLSIKLSEKLIGYGYVTIPKYMKVESSGHTYYYCGDDFKVNLGQLIINDNVVLPTELVFEDDKVYYNSNDVTELWNNIKNIFYTNQKVELTVKEGELITYDTDISSLEKTIDTITINGLSRVRNYVDIPYTDVENDGIECLVTYYDDNNILQENVNFYKTEDYFFESDGEEYVNRCFLRLDDIQMCTPRVYFKYAGMGKGLPLNSIVRFNIIITSGVDGEMSVTYTQEGDDISYNGISLPTLENDDSTISNIFDDCIINGCDLVQTGSNEETNDSIKTNAPRVYNSAHRLITNLDYQSACNRSTYVNDSIVWGGEDEFPRSPGHIWFSFLPEKSSERSFTSNTAKTEFKRNNSELNYNYAEGESKYQHALRQDYYQRNYILDTEIKKYENNRYSGVWGDLVGKYVPSLTFHHRHPLYLNFDYTFNMLRYNIKENTSDVHNELFNILDNCFYGNDLKLENFGVDYFHTNIVKRIDSKISDLCGFTNTLKTSIMLNEKTCCTENWKSEYKDIYIPLCVPFEKYFSDDGYVDISRLPNIDTEKFIDFKYDEIIPPTDTYESSDVIVNKYSYLRYSVVTGDLYTDWSKIKADQEYRKTNNLSNDTSTKVFIAPVKVDMTYKYYCSDEFIQSSDNYMLLGFKLAPSNTHDDIIDNITVRIYNENYQPDLDNTDNLVQEITNFNTYFTYNDNERNKLFFNSSFKSLLNEGYVIEVEFNRTCGYYYLFNTYKKEILIHLFVNGEYEGFSVASTGMRSNEYYEHYLDGFSNTFETNESEYDDNTMYADITYTSPRSYLYTTDRKYLISIEPTGIELEQEKHLYNYDQYGIRNDELDNRENESGTEKGHYLTTEGYLIDETEESPYTGPIVRPYNENMYIYTPLTLDLFRQNVFMNLKYPSENFRVHKNLIPRLNSVKFKNAVEVY